MGRRHRPFFRINAVEKRSPRNGKVLEALGWYDPMVADSSKAISLKTERIRAWLDRGAQPTETVGDLLAREGIIDAEQWNAKRAKRIAPKLERLAKAREAKAASESTEPVAAVEGSSAAAAADSATTESEGTDAAES